MNKLLFIAFLLISTIAYSQPQYFGNGIIADDSIVVTSGSKFGALGVLEIPYNWGTTGNYRVEVNDTTLNKWTQVIASRAIGDSLDNLVLLDSGNVWRTKSDFNITLPTFGERNINVVHNPGDGNLNFQVNSATRISINDVTSRLQAGSYFLDLNTTTGLEVENSTLDSVGIEFTSNNGGDDRIWSNGDQNYFSFIDGDAGGYVNLRAASPAINSDVVTKGFADSKYWKNDASFTASTPLTPPSFRTATFNSDYEFLITGHLFSFQGALSQFNIYDDGTAWAVDDGLITMGGSTVDIYSSYGTTANSDRLSLKPTGNSTFTAGSGKLLPLRYGGDYSANMTHDNDFVSLKRVRQVVSDSVNAIELNYQDVELTPAATTGDGQSTTLTISNNPQGYVMVFVNGTKYSLGDGIKTKDCYFSGDTGTTSRAISAIVATDVLYWNGLVAGFDLAGTDVIDLIYVK